MSPPATDLTLAASIADHGSCIALVKQRNGDGSNRYRFVMHVTRNSTDDLEAFRVASGHAGALRTIRIGRLAYWRLSYEGAKAYSLLKMLQPHLGERQLEAAAAIRYWEQGRHGMSYGAAGIPDAVKVTRAREMQRFSVLKQSLRTRARKPSAARMAPEVLAPVSG